MDTWPPPPPPPPPTPEIVFEPEWIDRGPTSRQKFYTFVIVVVLTLMMLAALSARSRADQTGQAAASELVTTVVMTAASDVADTHVNGSS